MGIPKGHTVLSAVVPYEVRDAVKVEAANQGLSASQLVGSWIDAALENAPGQSLMDRTAVAAVRARKTGNQTRLIFPRAMSDALGIDNGTLVAFYRVRGAADMALVRRL
jgi:3-deoxy-D-arabino-heptulosonate 7-phosphate (DAHP) synthase